MFRSSAVIAGKSNPFLRSTGSAAEVIWYSKGGPNRRHGRESWKLTRRSSDRPGHRPPLSADLDGAASLSGRLQVESRLLLVIRLREVLTGEALRLSTLESRFTAHCKPDGSSGCSTILCVVRVVAARQCGRLRIERRGWLKRRLRCDGKKSVYSYTCRRLILMCVFLLPEVWFSHVGGSGRYICLR